MLVVRCSLLPYGTGICHSVFTQCCIIGSFCPFLFDILLSTAINKLELSTIPACCSSMHFFIYFLNKCNIKGTNSLKIHLMFVYVCRLIFVYEFILWIWLQKGLTYIQKEMWIVHLLVTEFVCPEGTLYSWQDIQIQLWTTNLSCLLLSN